MLVTAFSVDPNQISFEAGWKWRGKHQKSHTQWVIGL